MGLLANFDDERSHLTELRTSFKKYNKAYIAVAFFTMSGFNAIKNLIATFLENGGELDIVVGLDNFVTEPDALQALFDLLKRERNSRLYLKKTHTKGRIFHPKFYLFESKKRGKIITGSANLAAGGLEENEEISLAGTVELPSPFWAHAIEVFKKCLKGARPASEVRIGRYKKEFLSQQKKQNFSDFDLDLDYAMLKKRLAKIPKEEMAQIRAERNRRHKEAKKILNEIATNRRLTQNEFGLFMDVLLDYKGGYWYSRDINRNKGRICDSWKEFVELVRFIRDNISESADEVFTEAKSWPVEGAGVNCITEIMTTFDPENFAVLNARTHTVLTKKVGVAFEHKNYPSFDGKDYARFCNIIKEICSELGFSTTLEADALLSMIYPEVKDDV